MPTSAYKTTKKQPSQTPSTAILSTHYFLYFGMMGIFLPYFNLLCHHLGLTGIEIGALNSIRTLVLIFFSFLWGSLADRFALRRPIFIAASLLSAAAWSGYLFTASFIPMLAVTIIYAAFFAPVIPFLEAFTMEALSRNKRPNGYGKIRAWGSLSFIGVVAIMGPLVEAASTRLVVPLILLFSILLSGASVAIPKNLSPAIKSEISELKDLFTPRVRRFLFANFLMLASHGTYYGFFSIHLEALGFGPTFIGIAWAVASIAELGVMMGSNSLFRCISVQQALLIAPLLAILRWALLFFATSWQAILLAQLLHAATYALFHMACILYIDQLSSPQNRTVAQVVNNSVSYGLGLMAGFLINGWLYDRYGAHLFLISAAISLASAFVIWTVTTPGGWTVKSR